MKNPLRDALHVRGSAAGAWCPRRLGALAAAVGLLACLTACGGDDTVVATATDISWKTAAASGGDTTNFEGSQSSTGFDTPAPNLAALALEMHRFGDSEFERQFIKAPSAQFPAFDGLGPAFNNSSCIACHVRDGRANYPVGVLAGAGQAAPIRLDASAGAFLRISVESGADCVPAAGNDFCAPVPVPGFSGQLFHRGVLDLRTDSVFSGQADVWLSFVIADTVELDGITTPLRRPVAEIRNPYDAPGQTAGENAASRLLAADVRTSLRIGPPVFGSGLLEAIPEADILALADPDDANGDGISGRPNRVLDPVAIARGEVPGPVLGRFGWKAGTPSVQAQGTGAYRNDMGITSYLFPTESIAGTALHDDYRTRHPGDDGQAASGHEVAEDVVKAVMFYTATLAVPARRNVDDPAVRAGADTFEMIGCASCHVPTFRTGSHPGIWGPGGNVAVPEVGSQIIHPYTDMLLHDMGDGLADGRTEFLANGREWRTRPLWGLGLTHTVNPLAGFLHDGRAATIDEAILWHGGEARAARDRFVGLDAATRAGLRAFLHSL
ncbi:MAG: di-heme oxidoredictase family protein [Burkholderiaceae bacterium]